MTTKKAPSATKINALSKRLMTITLENVGSYFGVEGTEPPAKPTLTAKEEKVVQAIKDGDFGCRTESVVNLIGALLGKDLIPLFNISEGDGTCLDDSDCVPGVVLVPTEHEDGHNYFLNKPAMCRMDSDRDNWVCIDEIPEDTDDVEFNYLTNEVSCLRLPTMDEIRELVTARYFLIERLLGDN